MSSSELDEQRFYQILAKEMLFEIEIGLTKKSIRKLQLKGLAIKDDINRIETKLEALNQNFIDHLKGHP